ncbi:MAG: hypothetical protein ACJ786_36375 [Catenulispora sp.]
MNEATALGARVLADERRATLAAKLTAAVLAGNPAPPGTARPPLAGSPVDRVDTLGNPYWRIVRNLPTEAGEGGDAPTTSWTFAATAVRNQVRAAGLDRRALCRRYSWSIPTPGDIAWISGIAGGRGVVELGAGGGYWAALMRAAGIDILAFDPFPACRTNGCATRAHTAVEPGDDTMAARHGDRALFLCWPSYNDPWAARALAAYRGDTLIYAGQDADGCTADDAFFELLEQDWELVDTSAEHVTFRGVPCRLTAWRR